MAPCCSFIMLPPPMKYFLLLLLVLPALVLTLLPETSPAPAAAPENVSAPAPAAAAAPLAVLELFTSQGCSSCPPADALLGEMSERATTGENIIALSFHVDYWNYLGWKDPFSSPYYSARQTDYTGHLGARTYTPQLVINGRREMVGSRRTDVKNAVENALKNERSTLPPSLSLQPESGGVTVAYTLPGEDFSDYRVTALLTQNEAVSAVKRGENRGKDLHHHNVVRAMQHAPAAAGGTFRLELPASLALDEVAVVLLVQDTRTHAISGAARAVVSAR